MPSDLSWLPERHLTVAATLAHADELLIRLTDVLFAYASQPGGTIALEEVRHGNVTRTTITAVAPLPRAIPLYAADVLTTLRAAVEHTVYAEVEHANRRPLTDVEARSIEMPAADTPEKFDKWLADRRKRAPKPLLLGSPLLARIRLLQPYQRTVSPQEHPMALLAAHSNLAKHRMPAVAAMRVAAIRPDDLRIDARVRILNPTEGPARAGDVLAETPIGVHVPVSLYPTLGINRPSTDQWPVLIKELDQLATWVRTQAVPILITGSSDVDPLPAAYDIAVGHNDDRDAINAGIDLTAAGRYSVRIGAAIARMNLPDLLEAQPDHADRDSINRWIDSLDDAAVMRRMGRVPPGNTYAHGLRTADAVRAMNQEARALDAQREAHT